MSATSRQRLLLVVLLPMIIASVRAEDSQWSVSGNVAVQTRVFTEDPLWVGQDPSTVQWSLSAEPEFRWRSKDGNQRASIIPFGRVDDTDEKRTHADLREGYWANEGDSDELLIGVNKVFWGVTESRHLVDIVNQTDRVEDIDQEEKLGQPMVNLALQQDWGLLDFYVLPYFRERTFPGVKGRFRLPLPFNTDNSVYESDEGQSHTDFALRYSHYLDTVDVGVYYFTGTSRAPRFVLASNGLSFIPHYDLIDQVGLDLQYTKEAWLWKLESIVRSGFQETFEAAVGGFEYSFYGVGESVADVGLLMEYQYDNRSIFEPPTLADNDLFVGTRFALNDAQNFALLAGVVYDTKTSETYFNIEAERRLGNNVVVELRVRAITRTSPQDLGYAISKDDYVQVQFSRFF
jgi:hypothetical protein